MAARDYASAFGMHPTPCRCGRTHRACPAAAADALTPNGAGLFQLLFRVRGLADVARCMVQEGLPDPVRGTLIQEKRQYLSGRKYAGGVSVVFVGTESTLSRNVQAVQSCIGDVSGVDPGVRVKISPTTGFAKVIDSQRDYTLTEDAAQE